MKTIARVIVFGALLSIACARARNARLIKFVGPQIGGPIAALPDLGRH